MTNPTLLASLALQRIETQTLVVREKVVQTLTGLT